MSEHIFKKNWEFVLGAPEIEFLPQQSVPEIAFVGRSNVGKSSIINALTNSKIARISNTPGRTRELNFFIPSMDEPPLMLVDMPGYGYAKASKEIVKNWNKVIFAYLKGRATLRRVFILIDARHGLKDNDSDVLDLLDKSAVSYQIILTKTDKIKDSEKIQKEILKKIERRPAAFAQVLATSARKNTGIDELKCAITFAAGLKQD